MSRLSVEVISYNHRIITKLLQRHLNGSLYVAMVVEYFDLTRKIAKVFVSSV